MSYEFTEQHNQTVKTLAGRMGFVGMFLILTGVLQWAIFVGIILVGLPNDQLNLKLNYIVSGTVSLLLGYWTKKSSNFFRLVSETQGSDMEHLMEAIVSLRKFYGLWLVCIVFTLFFTVIGGLIALGIITTLI